MGLSKVVGLQSYAKDIQKISRKKFKSTFLNFQRICELIVSAEDGHIEIK